MGFSYPLHKLSGNSFFAAAACANFVVLIISSMAKAASKPTAKPAKKSDTPKKAVAPKKKATTKPYQAIEDACVASLAKLQELELDYQLQSEINWCLGSYRNDGNPIGLYLMAERALATFREKLASKSKGVTASLVKDIEKALLTR